MPKRWILTDARRSIDGLEKKDHLTPVSFESTTGRSPPVDFATALLTGLAPDGGLYTPRALEPLDRDVILRFRDMALPEIAAFVLHHLLADELAADVLSGITERALDFGVPLVRLDDRTFVLELFHGPTLAFKDVGARCMAQCTAILRPDTDKDLTVLVATSGDTGGAVAHAFYGMPGTRVVVLFPRGRVSARQAQQFTTLGGNVTAVAVDGTFDDCQRLVKEMFADHTLRDTVPLTSANSINVGRLLPQIAYYLHAWAQLPHDGRRVIFSVPSGNLGNLAAGLMAKRLGLPVDRFVAATNANRLLPDYLERGDNTPRPAIHTISSAMDVGDPSNLARILHLYRGSRDRLLRDLRAGSYTDDETRSAIRDAFETHRYVLDPHSAVGYLALRDELQGNRDAVGIVLATAHPAKFAETVEPVIEHPVTLPSSLADCLDREPHTTLLRPRADELRALLAQGGGAGGGAGNVEDPPLDS